MNSTSESTSRRSFVVGAASRPCVDEDAHNLEKVIENKQRVHVADITFTYIPNTLMLTHTVYSSYCTYTRNLRCRLASRASLASVDGSDVVIHCMATQQVCICGKDDDDDDTDCHGGDGDVTVSPSITHTHAAVAASS